MLHGGDYNPDQWIDREDILKEDIRLMKAAGINSVSLGIFAWAHLEPEEGRYNFSFFDKVIDDLYKNGIYTILATPSGARPVWLAKKYPEVLRVNCDRNRILFSERHNHCYTSPVYRRKVREINTALANHYKNNPAIIAWHVSNEYSGECHCELCQNEFREWLKNKYHNNIDELNSQWWTSFWSHTYSSFDQIESPTTPSNIGECNVHAQVLDWRRFVTYQTGDFIKNEIAPLREITPDIPITANFMDFYQGLDYSKLRDNLDFISWDSYPNWHSGDDVNVACATAFMHDSMRSYLKKPFILMESTPSLVNWKSINKLKRPNLHKTASMQAVAHGSDSVLYFQIRKGRGSSEKFHGAVIDHAGHENTRVFREVSDVGRTLKKLDCIVGSETKSDVAIIYDTENRNALEQICCMKNGSDKQYKETLLTHYYPFRKNGINVDVIDSLDSFDDYKILIMPMLYMLKKGVEERIEQFVARGGIAVMTYSCAMANENDLCYLGGFPAGKLKEVFGVWAEEIDTLYDNERGEAEYDAKRYELKDYCEIVHPSTATLLAKYTKDFYAGEGVIFENKYEKGRAYYMAARDSGDMCESFYEKLIKAEKLNSAPKAMLPYGVFTTMREDDEYKYVFVQNYTDKEQTALFSDKNGIDMETDENAGGEIKLGSYGVRIIKFKK